ncbi:MAG: hypothetical protein E7168_00485 [Firmicutes bacterium]|nr:hypothetical protein [Bacillota bacterium]
MEQKKVKNLSIGWVVKADVISKHITPGFTPQRKIIYNDYNGYGVDFLYKNNKLPIIYPIVDFKNETQTAELENNEYVIIPFKTISAFCNECGIKLDRKVNYFDKLKIRKIIFGDSDLLLSKQTSFTPGVIEDLCSIREFKVYCNPIKPREEEYKYLEQLTSSGVKIYRK